MFHPNRRFALLSLVVIIGFWFSPLSFVPVPWPDDSAFYLPGVEWFGEVGKYRMHAQAPFVPSYDVANFNTMPLLPAMMGLFHQMGWGGIHSVRLLGMLMLALWASGLYLWLVRLGAQQGTSKLIAFLVAGAGLLSPHVRWGGMLVRPEIWMGAIWMLLLLELTHRESRGPRRLWKIAFYFAFSALIHFEAIFWVLPFAVGLYPFGDRQRTFQVKFKMWIDELVAIAWRTLILLSPWIIYVLLHWDIFWEQMSAQFGRLQHQEHPFVKDAYSWFHSLFLSYGSPVGFPKVYNVAKGIFVILSLVASIDLARTIFRRTNPRIDIALACLLGVISMHYLWMSKPEAWFTTLIHVATWPLIGFWCVTRISNASRIWKGSVLSALVVILSLEVALAGYQANQLKGHFSWSGYSRWVDCIESKSQNAHRVWQPHWPDVLVEMANRSPGREYFRSVDFEGIQDLLDQHAASMDVIIHTLVYPDWQERKYATYSGELREDDRQLLTQYTWLPFKEYSGLKLSGSWKTHVCQEGPFWAVVSYR